MCFSNESVLDLFSKFSGECITHIETNDGLWAFCSECDIQLFCIVIGISACIERAQDGEDDDELLGDESQATFWEVIKLATKYNEVEAKIRPDLSYYPE